LFPAGFFGTYQPCLGLGAPMLGPVTAGSLVGWVDGFVVWAAQYSNGPHRRSPQDTTAPISRNAQLARRSFTGVFLSVLF